MDMDLCGLMIVSIDLITTKDLIIEFLLQVLIFHELYTVIRDYIATIITLD